VGAVESKGREPRDEGDGSDIEEIHSGTYTKGTLGRGESII